MCKKEARIKSLKIKIQRTTSKGYATSGCVRKWEREIRHLSK